MFGSHQLITQISPANLMALCNDELELDAINFIPKQSHFNNKIETDSAPIFRRQTSSLDISKNSPEGNTTSATAAFECFASLQSRLNTYADWPRSLKQKPQALAEAGFIYLGIGDKVQCFFCGEGLNEWEENDDPWEEHAYWFPKCEYVTLKMGQAFIDTVKNKKSTVEITEKRNSVIQSPQDIETPEENREQDESTLCKICYNNNLEVLLNPCGHLVSCIECSSIIDTCPMCRKPISDRIRAFLS